MKVLGLCSYPIESAATRYRLIQYVEPLRERGIDLTVSPFLDSAQFARFYRGGGLLSKTAGLFPPLVKRVREAAALRRYDLLFVQREAMFFGPAVFERLFQTLGRLPVVLDLDDATYVRYVSPTYGRAGSFFKFFGKTDNLIRRAETVVCGNRFIAEYVEKKGARAVVVPTVVETGKFVPAAKNNPLPVIGWIGTHSTFQFLEHLFPVLRELSKKHRFVLKIVGAGRDAVAIDGVQTENVEWSLENELADFQSFDIGLYPLVTDGALNADWLLGKSGFKAIQYFAVGIPFVMTPIGVCAELGRPNETHFNAKTDEDWYNSLNTLLGDVDLRRRMGTAGRAYSLENFTVPRQAEIMARIFEDAAARFGTAERA